MKVLKTEYLSSPTQEVHSSCILFHEGHRLIVWFGGLQEGCLCNIYSKLDNHPTQKLIACPVPSNPQMMNSLWNPVLFSCNGSPALMYKSGAFCDRWQTRICGLRIVEKGLETTWKQDLAAGLHACVKSKPLALPDGTLVCGSSTETQNKWSAHVEIYLPKKEGLELLERSNPLEPEDSSRCKGIIQPTLWRDDDGTLHMLCRSSYGYGSIFHSKTLSSPGKWTVPRETGIPNPNSAVDVLKHSNGKTYLAYNPSQRDRHPLALSEFEIDGDMVRIKKTATLSTPLVYIRYLMARTRELSYPNVAEDSKGRIHISYTCCRAKIHAVSVRLSDP